MRVLCCVVFMCMCMCVSTPIANHIITKTGVQHAKKKGYSDGCNKTKPNKERQTERQTAMETQPWRAGERERDRDNNRATETQRHRENES